MSISHEKGLRIMDDVARYNIKRWNALAKARAVFSTPLEDLDESTARDFIDPNKILGTVKDKQVLCLGGGGGQQSVAFAILGAEVTVLDISDAQLQLDRDAARRYELQVTTIEGDMRDLSRFKEESFDIVDQPYSLNLVPDARTVFKEVARVLRHNGIYQFMCANPFYAGLQASDWDGFGYPLTRHYTDGAEISYADEDWVFKGKKPSEPINKAKEFRHSLHTLTNGLINQGFIILGIGEVNLGEPDFNAQPGTNNHFTSVAPPWLRFWSKKS